MRIERNEMLRKPRHLNFSRERTLLPHSETWARTFRVDVFGAKADEERRKKEDEDERARRRERGKVVWG